jgi:hypothetical protein
MKRRSFLQFLGLSPAAALAPNAVEAAKAIEELLPKVPEVPLYTSGEAEIGGLTDCSISCVCSIDSADSAYILPSYRK